MSSYTESRLLEPLLDILDIQLKVHVPVRSLSSLVGELWHSSRTTTSGHFGVFTRVQVATHVTHLPALFGDRSGSCAAEYFRSEVEFHSRPKLAIVVEKAERVVLLVHSCHSTRLVC